MVSPSMGTPALPAFAAKEAPPVPNLTQGGKLEEKFSHDWNLGPTGLRGATWAWSMIAREARQILNSGASKKQIPMSFNGHGRLGCFRWGFGLCLGLVWLCLPTKTYAICGLDAAVFEQIRNVQDLDAVRAWTRQILQNRGISCAVCHVAGFGPRNQYGSAINLLVTGNDREDFARKREAGRRVSDIPADPSLPDSPTFGDLIKQGLPPASDYSDKLIKQGLPPAYDYTINPAFRKVPARPQEQITVKRARELVQKAHEESRFGILQLSRTYEITPEVAEVLAEFQGEFLILGLTTLEPETAKALAKSRAGTVWLHSLTQMINESAEAIAKVPGHLVLSGLVELNSVPLAQKLAQRPGALSFPYLKQITREIAGALGRNPRSLTLAALTDVSPEVQDKLAETVGALTLPNLKSLDSLPLTKKLAAGFASSVLLPAIKTLSAEQANEIASVKRPFFLGGSFLPLSVMTEEVATVFAKNPAAGRLELGVGSISEPSLKILVQSQLSIVLREVDSLSDEQVRILATAADSAPGGPFGTQTKISQPKLKTLDSPLLAKALLRCSSDFGGVTRISRGAAAALAEVVYPNGRVRVLPPYSLSFPSLEELPPETARLLMTRPWSAISLPALKDVSPETLRSIVRQTSGLTLGLTTLSPELASAFGEMASNEGDLGGGTLALPYLTELSPEAARILVTSLNRGTEVPTWGGLTKAPQLFLGGRVPGGLSFKGSSPPLTPELAAELAKYRGRLSIAGLQELSPQSAASLVPYRGPRLELSGPATDRLSPETAAALAKFPGTLDMPLRVLDSVPLAEKFARQSSRVLDGLEGISGGAIPAYVKYNGFFTLRQLSVLDSPALAARLIQDSSGRVLPSLQTITPAAAEVLASGPNAPYLGLRVLDDPAVARALAKSRKGANLPRLRAATPEVIAILRDAKSITTPPLDSIYVLSFVGVVQKVDVKTGTITIRPGKLGSKEEGKTFNLFKSDVEVSTPNGKARLTDLVSGDIVYLNLRDSGDVDAIRLELPPTLRDRPGQATPGQRYSN